MGDEVGEILIVGAVALVAYVGYQMYTGLVSDVQALEAIPGKISSNIENIGSALFSPISGLESDVKSLFGLKSSKPSYTLGPTVNPVSTTPSGTTITTTTTSTTTPSQPISTPIAIAVPVNYANYPGVAVWNTPTPSQIAQLTDETGRTLYTVSTSGTTN